MNVMNMRVPNLTYPLVLLSASLATFPGCTSTVAGSDDADTGGAGNTATGGNNGTGADNTGGSGNNETGGADNTGTGGGGNDETGGAGNTATGGSATGGTGEGGDDVTSSMGCGNAPPEAGRKSITVGNLTREYIIALPENYDPEKPYKLIFTWHPWGGSAQQVAGTGANGYYGLRGASAGEAILVSPEGLDFGGNGLGWGNSNGQDIEFARAMLDRFDDELCFDHNRIFSTGFSFGGMMSNSMACSGLVRAIAPMAGNSQGSGCANGTQPVAYMGFHGVDDTVVTPGSGRIARDIFVSRNGCGAATASDSNWCELAGGNNQPCECTTYEGCDEGYPVTWCEFKNGHTPAPNSAQTIWDFFSQF
jgi:polyhydroxybutyrate depolymerase